MLLHVWMRKSGTAMKIKFYGSPLKRGTSTVGYSRPTGRIYGAAPVHVP
jgi:hypothetical protein